MRGPGDENPKGRHRVNKPLVWGTCGLVAPVIMAAALLPDNSLTWALLAPLGFVCFVGWLITGITMLHSWQKALTGADGTDGTDAQPMHRPARARAARAAAWGLYVIVMPAAVSAWIVPGYTTAARAIAVALEVYAIFWLLGGVMVIASRRGWLDPT